MKLNITVSIMIDFNINSGKIEIQENLKDILSNKILVLRTNNETVSCDGGFCETISDISLKIKRHCNDPGMFFFINDDIEIAMDEPIFNSLSHENIVIKKQKHLVIERIKHNPI